MEDQESKDKLRKALRDVSNATHLIEAQRDIIKEIKDDVCEELMIEKKVFNRLARAYHKGNFKDEVTMNDEFEELYREVVDSGNR